MEAVISYDKRADQVILAGKGINASITNVENDGVLSKSGSAVYYNYLIYANALVIAEFYVTQDINRAIRYNFPYAVKGNIRLGFRIDIPVSSKKQLLPIVKRMWWATKLRAMIQIPFSRDRFADEAKSSFGYKHDIEFDNIEWIAESCASGS
ncbi:MAG: hypothetical protein ACLUDU_02230 [Butyricimonas faecihominis]